MILRIYILENRKVFKCSPRLLKENMIEWGMFAPRQYKHASNIMYMRGQVPVPSV